MRYSVHIMFGQNFAQMIQEMKKYIIKYGEKSHSPYFKGLLWDNENNNKVLLSTVDLICENENIFKSFLENSYHFDLSKQEFDTTNNKKDLIRFFRLLQQTSINLDNQGSRIQMHYCLYFPLFDQLAYNSVKECISILNSVELPIEIDLFGLDYDLVELLTDDIESVDVKQLQQKSRELTRSVLELKKIPKNNIYHFILLQNSQSSGISLNLSSQTLTKIISEFAILCIESYDELFTTVQNNFELQGLGLALISLDKYYFVEYLFHKAYLHALEREGIKGIDKIEDVDVVMATNKAQEILKSKIHILSVFFDNEIKPRLSNGKSQDVIIQEITPILRQQMENSISDYEAFITDDSLSIPAKRAIFSALLGEDDELFENYIFIDDPLWIDDIDFEAIQVFIDANNALITIENQKSEAILSEGGKPVISQLSEIRKLRTKIIRTTGYIRKLEKEVDFLSKQVSDLKESKKSLNSDGFYEFMGNSFQLLPKIEEISFSEDYLPHAPTSTVVDLRSGFTSIKNQGKSGACTAFSLTSIYEYILKSNKQKEYDLSEAFLFYNARLKSKGENDLSGSRIDYAIESLVEKGICLEEKWPIKNGSDEEIIAFYKTEPSMEAFDDALLRRVKKAVNVKLVLNDLKSALEDGYPIEISTTLFDSFGSSTAGVIPYPTENEIEAAKSDNTNRGHAMVICGYSDEDKLFVVRNSWGTDFGDNGYCYLPYTYVTNNDITKYAVAITEVEAVSAQGSVNRTSLPFGDDTRMRFAVKKNALDEERRHLETLKSSYEKLKVNYNKLHESIINPHVQKNLTNSNQIRLTEERNLLREKYNQAFVAMDEQLSAFDKFTKVKSVVYTLPFVLMIVLELIYCYFFKMGLKSEWWYADNGIFAWIYNKEFFIILTLLLLGILVIGIYITIRIKKRKILKEELQRICDDYSKELAQKEKELNINKLYMHFAGMILLGNSTIEHSLSNKYHFMQSFFVNLNTWHTLECNSLKMLDCQSQSPFISVIKNNTLDNFFASQCDELTKNISFCDIFVENFVLTEEGIIAFQDKIKYTFCTELLGSISEFSIYSYFAYPRESLFLDSVPSKKLLSELEANSDVFVRHSKSPNASKNIFILTKTEDEKHNWQTISRPHFAFSPTQNAILSPLKLIMIQLEELNINDLC